MDSGHDIPDPGLDALLRDGRPRPDAEWVRSTERRLLPPRRRTPAPVVRMGAVVAAGLAALLLALSLAGVGPLAGSDRDVQARDDCKTVRVTRLERVPAIARPVGTATVVYTRKPVTRFERRCRRGH